MPAAADTNGVLTRYPRAIASHHRIGLALRIPSAMSTAWADLTARGQPRCQRIFLDYDRNMITLERGNPSQTVVPHQTSAEDPAVSPPSIPISLGKAMIVSVAACTVAFLVGVTLAVWVPTGDLVAALGLGLFASFWGGIGFGLMAGGAVYTLGQERVARAALAEQRQLVVDRGPDSGAAPVSDLPVSLLVP